MRVRVAPWRVLAAVLLTACESGSPGQPIVVENEGRICVHGDPSVPGAQTFAANAPIHLAYQSQDECLSSSCTSDRSSACAASIDNGVIELSAVISWRDISRQQGACTADCVLLAAECTTAALPAGTFEVRFGSGRMSLVIPSQHAAPPCIDAR